MSTCIHNFVIYSRAHSAGARLIAFSLASNLLWGLDRLAGDSSIVHPQTSALLRDAQPPALRGLRFIGCMPSVVCVLHTTRCFTFMQNVKK
jgi:hypothetical protein